MSRYTSLGCALWDWPRWGRLSLGGRNLWLALYTSPESKRMPPGLWHGGVAALSEAAKVELADASAALDELLERGLADHDPLTRVIRLTELPDRGERASNGRVVRSWWTRWETVPPCAVRDAHVELLAWLLEPMTDDHRKVWSGTFGTVVKPFRDGIGNGIGDRPGNRYSNGTTATASLFPDAQLGNGMRDGTRNQWVPDQDQDQGEEIQEGRDGDRIADGSGDVVIGGIPVSAGYASEPGMADVLARAMSRFAPVPDPATERARAASLAADRRRG